MHHGAATVSIQPPCSSYHGLSARNAERKGRRPHRLHGPFLPVCLSCLCLSSLGACCCRPSSWHTYCPLALHAGRWLTSPRPLASPCPHPPAATPSHHICCCCWCCCCGTAATVVQQLLALVQLPLPLPLTLLLVCKLRLPLGRCVYNVPEPFVRRSSGVRPHIPTGIAVGRGWGRWRAGRWQAGRRQWRAVRQGGPRLLWWDPRGKIPKILKIPSISNPSNITATLQPQPLQWRRHIGACSGSWHRGSCLRS